MGCGAILRRKLSNNVITISHCIQQNLGHLQSRAPLTTLIHNNHKSMLTFNTTSQIGFILPSPTTTRHSSTSAGPKRGSVLLLPTIWSTFQSIPRSLRLVLQMTRPLLSDMCALMGITPFGKDGDLRVILCDKLKSIKNNDMLIQSKGVELLSEAEICKACTERGMHVAEEMQQQLHDWLDLSLNHAVPTSLLIISRVITPTQKLKPEEVMLATLSSLPYDLVYTVGVASLPCKDPILDKNRKIKFLKLQEKIIKEEEKELSEMEQSDAIQDA